MSFLKVIGDNLIFTGGVVTAVSVLGLMVAKGWKKVKNFMLSFETLFELPLKVSQMETNMDNKFVSIEASVATVKKEVLPNGGSSFRDEVGKKMAMVSNKVETVAAMNRVARERLNIPTFECDEHGVGVDVSDTFCQMVGLPRDEVIGNGWLVAIPTVAERESVQKEWEFCIKNMLPYHGTFRIHNAKKELCLVTSHATPVLNDEKNGVVGYVGCITSYDIVTEPDKK